MASTEKFPMDADHESIAKHEFDTRDRELTEALDELEKEALPPKPKPAPIGGMF